MDAIRFEAYTRPNGHNEYQEFAASLPKADRAKLLAVVGNVERFGMLVAQRQEWVRRLDKNLYELRSKTGSNIQRAVYFHVVGGRYVITHGFTKKTQKTPKSEISHAKELRKEFYDNEQ